MKILRYRYIFGNYRQVGNEDISAAFYSCLKSNNSLFRLQLHHPHAIFVYTGKSALGLASEINLMYVCI